MKLTALFAAAILSAAAGCESYPIENFHIKPRFAPLSEMSQSRHVMQVMQQCAELVRRHAAEADGDTRNALYVECITFHGAAI